MKDKSSSVTGRVLAEKKDQVIVDIGFTALVIPRDQIAKIVSADPASVPAKKVSQAKRGESQPEPMVASTAADAMASFYNIAKTPPPERSVRELVQQLGQGVVQVRTPGGLGSGFFLNEEGFLITNFHVIEGETQISIEVYHLVKGQLDRRSYRQVRIVAMNKFSDLALLKVEDKDSPKFARVSLGNSDILGVGERVFAIGSPLGLERTVTEGIVSTKTRPFQGELYLQTTAQINPGNSGGPLFNMRGEVIGVTNMKVTSGEGLGFAIPIEEVKNFLHHRDAFAYDNDNPSNAYRYLPAPSRVQSASIVAQ
ncbi:MAG: trypsin-like peptidase domain-containing protein [Verrucomicrobia bacterium]|nr:trypsin-like peptidase domain-containing protein [Verrucomicrobiota bacterium]